ncbi:MFS transporter [Agaribacterium haliotis]|uniref:MFS transporter n=1 Tax=Agaribacterium haliotis TaxID=2013869 RepID=UPI000BB55065|nr:MFS transporter [Agaribacterium haliotis]
MDTQVSSELKIDAGVVATRAIGKAAPAEQAPSKLFANLALMFALFLAAMDATVVSTMLPLIERDFNNSALLSWLVSAFFLSQIVSAATAGTLAESFGEKALLSCGLLLMIVGMASAVYANTLSMLVASRVLQGLGAGLVITMVYVLAGRLWPAQERGKMQALLSLIWGLAAVIGPVFAGVVLSLYQWPKVFIFYLPLLIVSLIAVQLFYRSSERFGSSGAFDIKVLASFSVALVTLLVAISSLAEGLWLSSSIALVTSVLALLFYLRSVSKQAELEVIPRELILRCPLRCAWQLSFLASAVLFASATFVPLYLMSRVDDALTSVATIVSASSLGWVVGAALCGALYKKVQAHKLAFIGAILLFSGAAANALFAGELNVLVFIIAQLCIGLGIGFCASISLVFIQNRAGDQLLARYTAAVQLSRNLGAAIGVSLAGSVQIFSGIWFGGNAPYSAVFILLAVLAFLSVFPALGLQRQQTKAVAQ